MSRWLPLAAAIAIAAGAFEPFYLRIFTTDRARISAALTELPYRKLPGLRRFLLEVQSRTRDGDAIAIAAPLHRAAQWEGGYDYIVTRSPYLLAGRQVIPLIDMHDRPVPQNLAGADWVAAYHEAPAIDGFATVWRGPDGVLLRRVK